jgi:FtsZ-binding cell division protein ZapB
MKAKSERLKTTNLNQLEKVAKELETITKSLIEVSKLLEKEPSNMEVIILMANLESRRDKLEQHAEDLRESSITHKN